MTELVKNWILIIGLTLLTGYGDSRGFVHAARIWKNGHVVWDEILQSGFGFGLGIVTYWIAIKFLKEVGVSSAEMQTLIWFGVTIIGVAISSGEFARWKYVEQTVAVAVLLGIGWLLIKTSG